MKIKKAAVLGAGAVGSYMISGLSKLQNIELGVIAEGERAEQLERDGIKINGDIYRPKVWTPQEAHGADLLIVALKYGSLVGALDSIKAAVGENTIVMSLMNGVAHQNKRSFINPLKIGYSEYPIFIIKN